MQHARARCYTNITERWTCRESNNARRSNNAFEFIILLLCGVYRRYVSTALGSSPFMLSLMWLLPYYSIRRSWVDTTDTSNLLHQNVLISPFESNIMPGVKYIFFSPLRKCVSLRRTNERLTDWIMCSIRVCVCVCVIHFIPLVRLDENKNHVHVWWRWWRLTRVGSL